MTARLVGDRPYAHQPGCSVASGHEWSALGHEILAAMTQGSIVTVRLAGDLGGRIGALSGGSLPCAVLCPSATAP